MSTGTPTVVTDRTTFLDIASDGPTGARIPVEVRVTVDDPFTAYRRARPAESDDSRASTVTARGVYLETTGGQPGWGYFGVDPIQRLQVAPTVEPIDDTDTAPSLDALGAVLDAETLRRGPCDVPYPCGAVGWLSYDIARELETLPETTANDRGLPRLQLAVFDRLAAWREPREEHEPADGTTLRITACPRVESSPADAFERGRERALELARAATDGTPTVAPPPVREATPSFASDCTTDAYADRVARVRSYIREGDTFQANISQRLTAPASVHPVDVFAALRDVNPAPYSALLEFPGVDLVSASPELLLDVGDNHGATPAPDDRSTRPDRLLTEPIAGTRPRGETPEGDAELEADLLGDAKERAEHAMLVDLERNDLGKVSATGTVTVPEYRRVDRYSEVMHLVSLVEGRLQAGQSITDAIAAVFPGGTITGAPKPRTMEIIDEVESTRRGPYTGSIGVFGFDGRATLNIIIRTLVRHGGKYYLRVGGGIVHDSVPEREYDETIDKARALVSAVDEALADTIALEVSE